MYRPRVYLSGPLTKGDRSHNVCQFMQAHEVLMKAGFAVMNPGLTALIPWAWDMEYKAWIASDLPWVEVADLVIRLPGESVGADMEVEHAEQLGIPVQRFHSVLNLIFCLQHGSLDEYKRQPAAV